MNDELYQQCLLKRNNGNLVSWIPVRGAIKGAYVELKEDGTLWQVSEVYDGTLSYSYLQEKRRMDNRSLLSIK